MTSPILQLNRYTFPIMKLEANPEWDGTPLSTDDITAKFFIRQAEDDETNEAEENCYSIYVTLEINGDTKKTPYKISIMAFGHFSVDNSHDFENDSVVRMAAFNGATILYGAIRDTVHTLSGKSVWDRIDLPAKVFGPDDYFDFSALHDDEDD